MAGVPSISTQRPTPGSSSGQLSPTMALSQPHQAKLLKGTIEDAKLPRSSATKVTSSNPRFRHRSPTHSQDMNDLVVRIRSFLHYLPRSSMWFRRAFERYGKYRSQIRSLNRRQKAARQSLINDIINYWAQEEEKARNKLQMTTAEDASEMEKQLAEKLSELSVPIEIKQFVVKEIYFRECSAFHKRYQDYKLNVQIAKERYRALRDYAIKNIQFERISPQLSNEDLGEDTTGAAEWLRMLLLQPPAFAFTPETVPFSTLLTTFHELSPTIQTKFGPSLNKQPPSKFKPVVPPHEENQPISPKRNHSTSSLLPVRTDDTENTSSVTVISTSKMSSPLRKRFSMNLQRAESIPDHLFENEKSKSQAPLSSLRPFSVESVGRASNVVRGRRESLLAQSRNFSMSPHIRPSPLPSTSPSPQFYPHHNTAYHQPSDHFQRSSSVSAIPRDLAVLHPSPLPPQSGEIPQCPPFPGQCSFSHSHSRLSPVLRPLTRPISGAQPPPPPLMVFNMNNQPRFASPPRQMSPVGVVKPQLLR